MRTAWLGTIAVAAILYMLGAQVGNARLIIAGETTGRPGGDLTFMTDSGLPVGAPPPCATANEDTTACFGTPYSVPTSLIAAASQANGGIVGVDLIDSAAEGLCNGAPCLSDQLYLSVGPATGGANSTNTLTWCWDSDLEPNVNICQQQIPVPTSNLFSVAEPAVGFVDLTRFFTGPLGPLAGGGAWQVLAISEVPEPASFTILAASLFGIGAFWRRFRK